MTRDEFNRALMTAPFTNSELRLHDAEQRQVIEQLKARLDLVGTDFTANMVYQGQLEKRNADLMEHIATLREALKELYALVQGECPRLFNEDSGGDAELGLKIEQALKEVKE